MEQKTRLDIMREELKKLMEERKKAQREKGESAEYNKDLRENADYDYWLHREMALTYRIRKLTAEIQDVYDKKA